MRLQHQLEFSADPNPVTALLLWQRLARLFVSTDLANTDTYVEFLDILHRAPRRPDPFQQVIFFLLLFVESRFTRPPFRDVALVWDLVEHLEWHIELPDDFFCFVVPVVTALLDRDDSEGAPHRDRILKCIETGMAEHLPLYEDQDLIPLLKSLDPACRTLNRMALQTIAGATQRISADEELRVIVQKIATYFHDVVYAGWPSKLGEVKIMHALPEIVQATPDHSGDFISAGESVPFPQLPSDLAASRIGLFERLRGGDARVPGVAEPGCRAAVSGRAQVSVDEANPAAGLRSVPLDFVRGAALH
jgi:hypothetical protein